MKTAPFFGKGIAFPFRINPVTGGVQVTQGGMDSLSVMLEYLNESWTIREPLAPEHNHVAEAIAHILLTHLTEHDTLPNFGSRLFEILFSPNTPEFEQLAAFWMQHSTERWEKRARVPQDGTAWQFTGRLADEGRAPVAAFIEFIAGQVEGNLVSPFVTSRQARVQEYPAREIDASGHEYGSRYYGIDQAMEGDILYTRFPRSRQFPPAVDDQYYQVAPDDTWNLISWRNYDDIRYWPIVAEMYEQDNLDEEDFDRDVLDVGNVPEAGTMVRIPSRSRLLMELSVPAEV